MSFCDTFVSPEQVRRFLAMEESDRCEHVQANPTLAYGVFVEHSDMGIHDARVVCQPCLEQAEEAQANGTEWCIDCKTSKPARECLRWREWDFNPSEGGEDLYVCQACRALPKHKARVERDERDRQRFELDMEEGKY
jgi:hypothetical protein